VVLQNVKVLIDEETIQARVKELACRISDDYRDKETPLMVGLLDGVHIFMSDLVRYMDIDLEEVFIKAISYGAGTESSGKVDIYCYKPLDVKGRHVIIVDELIDTGNTLEALLNLFKDQGAASLESVKLGKNAVIGDLAFYNNDSLVSIDLSTVKSVGKSAKLPAVIVVDGCLGAAVYIVHKRAFLNVDQHAYSISPLKNFLALWFWPASAGSVEDCFLLLAFFHIVSVLSRLHSTVPRLRP